MSVIHNTLVITGPKDELVNFKEFAKSEEKNKLVWKRTFYSTLNGGLCGYLENSKSELDFKNFIPFSNGYKQLSDLVAQLEIEGYETFDIGFKSDYEDYWHAFCNLSNNAHWLLRHWKHVNWGSPTNADIIKVTFEENKLIYNFDTYVLGSKADPKNVINAMAILFPNLLFELNYYSFESMYEGEFIVKGSNIELSVEKELEYEDFISITYKDTISDNYGK